MQLSPNTYLGLTWGLTHFDGIETDIRLSKDDEIIIYHDTHCPSGEKIADLTLEELNEMGIPNLRSFFSIPLVQELSETKHFFIELKPNCNGTTRVIDPIKNRFFDAFQDVVKTSEINEDSIHMISFSKDLLDPFADTYPCYPLLPDVNECSQRWVALKAMPQVLGRSLSTEIDNAHDRGFAGVFFARQYVMGWTSIRHPSYEKAVEHARSLNMLLGTNLGTPDLEDKYPDFVRFSDKLSNYPRYAKDGEGAILAHRGTGTKGVEVPEEDIPEIPI